MYIECFQVFNLMSKLNYYFFIYNFPLKKEREKRNVECIPVKFIFIFIRSSFHFYLISFPLPPGAPSHSQRWKAIPMQQLRQTFFPLGLVFEPHDLEEVPDSELEEIQAREREQRGPRLEKGATIPAAGAARCRSPRGE